MKRIAQFLLLSLSFPSAYASDSTEFFVDLEKLLQQFWVELESASIDRTSFTLKFIILPIHNSSPVKLDIKLEGLKLHRISDLTYSFNGSDDTWPIADYVYPSQNYFEVYLPGLRAGQRTEFSISWSGLPAAQLGAFAMLTTDNRQFVQQWVGEQYNP